MSLPVSFSALPSPSEQPASLLDENFAAVGALTVIPCICAGSGGAIVLQPLANTPAVNAYGTLQLFSFVATRNIASVATLAVGTGNAAHPLTMIAGGTTINIANEVLYFAAYDAGNTRFVLLDFDTVNVLSDQTIGGIKTFSQSPLVPTAQFGDSSQSAANTAFVQAQFASGAVVVLANSAAISASTFAASINVLVVGGAAELNDGGQGVFTRQASNPGTVSAVQSKDGAWWDRPLPSPYQRLDFDYFLYRTANAPAAFVAGMQALFQEATDYSKAKMVLDCQGIPIIASSMLYLRSTIWNDGLGNITWGGKYATPGVWGRTLRDVNIICDGGAGWNAGDSLLSFEASWEGAGHDDINDCIRKLWIDGLTLNMTNAPCTVNGFRFSGYAHMLIERAYVPNLGNANTVASTVAGIDLSNCGLMALIDDPRNGQRNSANTGLHVVHMETTGGINDSVCPVYTECTDTTVFGGILSGRGYGVWSRFGQIKTEGVHFSLSPRQDDGTRSWAIIVDNPVSCQFSNDELDNALIYIRNRPDNTATPGTALAAFGPIDIDHAQINNGSTGYRSGWGAVTLEANLTNSLIGNTVSVTCGWAGISPQVATTVTTDPGITSPSWAGSGQNPIYIETVLPANAGAADFAANGSGIFVAARGGYTQHTTWTGGAIAAGARVTVNYAVPNSFGVGDSVTVSFADSIPALCFVTATFTPTGNDVNVEFNNLSASTWTPSTSAVLGIRVTH